MKILNVEISAKCENIINNICKSLSKPVEYVNIAEINRTSFGSCDYSNPEKYIVYLQTSLYGVPFETNVLHELYHIIQTEEKYPTTISKRIDIPNTNTQFISMLGSNIQSMILDMDVNERLSKIGYDSLYFHKTITKNAEHIFYNNELEIHDKYDIAHYAPLTTLVFKYAKEEKSRYIQNHALKQYSKILLTANELLKLTQDIGFQNKFDCFKLLSNCITLLDVWDCQAIRYDNSIFDSESDYLSYISQTTESPICT